VLSLLIFVVSFSLAFYSTLLQHRLLLLAGNGHIHPPQVQIQFSMLLYPGKKKREQFSNSCSNSLQVPCVRSFGVAAELNFFSSIKFVVSQ